MNSNFNIFHISSVHSRYDSRIFTKECISLTKAGNKVSFIVCDGKGNEEKSGVKIIDAGDFHSYSRKKRMLLAPKAIEKKLLQTKVDIVHFHDPELLFLGKKFAKKGIKVIYDSHENVPAQILSKPYLSPIVRKLVSQSFAILERNCVRNMAGVISVTEENVNRLLKYNAKTILVRNFPVLESFHNVDFDKKEMKFLYAGGVTKLRSAVEMVQAADKAKIKIDFYGPVANDLLDNELENEYANFYGNINQQDLFEIYKSTSVGLILFKKVPNHMNCSPNKLFEYMASGMAVIASDIPMWKKIVEKYQCGICVDPTNIDAIAEALTWMKEHSNETRQMGEHGRKSVFEHFSWEKEKSVLEQLYKEILG